MPRDRRPPALDEGAAGDIVRGVREATSVFEITARAPLDPVAAVKRCLESGNEALLFAADALPESFFDLRTGVAGEVVQRLVNYGLRMAAVVPDPAAHGERFTEFAREAARGRGPFRFFADRDAALDWLTAPR